MHDLPLRAVGSSGQAASELAASAGVEKAPGCIGDTPSGVNLSPQHRTKRQANASEGMRPGDRIYRIAGRSLAGGEEFRTLAMTLPAPVEVLLEREGRIRVVTLRVPPPLAAE